MIKKQDKEQFFSGSFVAEADEEIILQGRYNEKAIVRFSLKFLYGTETNSRVSMTWKNDDGFLKFTVTGFQRGLEGLGSTDLAQIGKISGRDVYLQVAYGVAGGNARLVHVFLYLGGGNA